ICRRPSRTGTSSRSGAALRRSRAAARRYTAAMKRPLGTIGIALALFALVGAILLARWLLWFGPGLPDRDYAADFHAHALEINGVTAEEGAAGWAAYEAVVDAVVAAAESVTGEPA